MWIKSGKKLNVKHFDSGSFQFNSLNSQPTVEGRKTITAREGKDHWVRVVGSEWKMLLTREIRV